MQTPVPFQKTKSYIFKKTKKYIFELLQYFKNRNNDQSYPKYVHAIFIMVFNV